MFRALQHAIVVLRDTAIIVALITLFGVCLSTIGLEMYKRWCDRGKPKSAAEKETN